jgi:hypothetical protein
MNAFNHFADARGIRSSRTTTPSTASLSRPRFFLRIAALDCCGVPCPTNRDSYRLSMLNLCALLIHRAESPVTFGTACQQAIGIGEFPARKVYERQLPMCSVYSEGRPSKGVKA